MANKAKTAKPETTKPVKQALGDKLIAAVLVRGRRVGVRHDVQRTLDNLKMQRNHICVVYNDSASLRGMLNKCKDLVTYGPITKEVLAALEEKRGSLKDRDGNKLYVFRMNPPKGGWGRKGIKVSYQNGGCLGYRAKGMAAQLEKMM